MRLTVRLVLLSSVLALVAGCAMSERQGTLLETQALAGDAATFTKIESKAREGDPVAELTMGRILAVGGANVSRDEAKAFSWFKKSADHGNARARTNVGICLFYGRGVPMDPAGAIPWLTKGAEGGIALAQFTLGLAHALGQGTPKDASKSTEWLRKAESHADPAVDFLLASYYDAGMADPFKASLLLRRASDNGYSKARVSLAKRILKDKTGGDTADAVRLLEQSAAQGDASAYYELAELHRYGTRIPKDEVKACELYGEASEKGHPDATFRAAICALGSNPGRVEEEQAKELIRKAAKLGSLVAQAVINSYPNWPERSNGPRPLARPASPAPSPRPETTSPAGVSKSTAPASIFDAARDGNLASVKSFIAAGGDVNGFDVSRRDEKQTALHQAMRAPSDSVAEYLIEHGADVNAKASTGYTPLHIASGLGKVTRVQLLLRKGAIVDAPDTSGTPLHAATIQGQAAAVDLLLNAGADPNARTPGTEETPLTLLNNVVFYLRGHDTIVRRLVEAGADVNAKAKNGNRPIGALARGKEDTALYLLDKGAHTKDVHVNGAPLAYAYASYGKVRVLERLLADGYPMGEKENGTTLVHHVAHHADVKVMELLLRKGADINAKSARGRTPLHDAAIARNDRMIALLLNAGADPNIADEDGRTPLFVLLAEPGLIRSSAGDALKALPALSAHRARFDVFDREGNLPMHWFVRETYIGIGPDVPVNCEIAHQLSLRTGINAKSRNGDNALHALARRDPFSSGQYIIPPLARCLLEMGADPDARNNAGETPSDVARKAFPNPPHPILKVLAEPSR